VRRCSWWRSPFGSVGLTTVRRSGSVDRGCACTVSNTGCSAGRLGVIDLPWRAPNLAAAFTVRRKRRTSERSLCAAFSLDTSEACGEGSCTPPRGEWRRVHSAHSLGRGECASRRLGQRVAGLHARNSDRYCLRALLDRRGPWLGPRRAWRGQLRASAPDWRLAAVKCEPRF